MGGGFSLLKEETKECGPVTTTGLGDIPGSCVSLILGYLDPPAICRLARVNKTFFSASSADFVWESKLPSNYRFLVENVLGEDPKYLSKKEIYAKLCRSNFFDAGTKEVWLDRITGNMCLSISYKALKITGIDDRRYWNLIPTDESRFQTVAYLQQIWWVEVVGEIEFHFLPGTYGLYFKLQLGQATKRLGRRACNLDRVHGWDIKPVRFKFSTSNGQHCSSECYLHKPGKWIHYHVGDFVVDEPNEPLKIKFSMIQIDCTHTKGGLCVDSVVVCQSGIKERLKLS